MKRKYSLMVVLNRFAKCFFSFYCSLSLLGSKDYPNSRRGLKGNAIFNFTLQLSRGFPEPSAGDRAGARPRARGGDRCERQGAEGGRVMPGTAKWDPRLKVNLGETLDGSFSEWNGMEWNGMEWNGKE